MSTTVDQRVVQMDFDNARFEKNAAESISTIKELNQSLKLENSAKGFDSLSAAANKVNLSGVGSAVESLKNKFSALEIAGITALVNITNSAVNAGKKIASSLTIDPIKSGFEEYETQINAVQTILANTSSKGTNLKQVNAALDELNHYADLTIYNFTEMTRNIGTFTAAGVGLQTSVSAIKGISNLAAVSGSTSAQASTAMYQLSQALAAGTVKLQDWNSVVNAGMGGEVFQKALKDTARVHGVTIDKMIAKEGSFRETLKDGWLTSGILTETLAKFTGDMSEQQLESIGYTKEQIEAIVAMGKTANDAATKVKTFTQLFDTLKEAAQSGWTQSWQTIVGDFEEAKDLLTQASDTLGDMISKSSDARNDLLKGGLRSTWDQFIESWSQSMGDGIAGVESYKDTIKVVAKEHGVALDEMIDKEGSFEGTLKNGWLNADIMGESLSRLTTKMSGMSDEQLKNEGYTREQINALMELNESVQNGSVSMNQFTDNLGRMSGRENLIEAIKNAFTAVLSVINPVKEAFREVFPPTTAEQLYKLTEGLKNLTSYFILSETQSENLKRTFKGLFSVLDIGVRAVSAIATAVFPLLGNLKGTGEGILEVTASIGDWLSALDETVIKTDLFNNAIKNITKFVSSAVKAVGDFITLLGEKIGFPGFEIFHNFLQRLQERMSDIGDAIGDMKSVTIIAVKAIGDAITNSNMLKALSALWTGVTTITKGIIKAFGDLFTSLADKIGKANFNNLFDIVSSLSIGGVAIAISKFLKSLSEPLDGLSGILESVTSILDGVRGSIEAYQTQIKAKTLLTIASAIGILAASILVISLIDSAKLAAALGSISILFANLMGSMAIFGKLSGDLSGIAKASGAMIAMSISILILASALKKVGELDFGQMVVGLAGVVGLTATMVAASKIMSSGTGTIVKGATQMILFAAAIKILASACEDLSSLSWSELSKGLVGVGVLLAEISLFLNTAKFSGKSISTAAGIIILSAAIKILASACKDFASMEWDDIGKGLTAIGVLLAEIAAFTNVTGNAKHVISTGVSLIAIGAALLIFASAVRSMADMSWEELGRGLTGMAASLLAVTIAMNLMPKNMIGTGLGMIAVSAALLIISKAVQSMGSMSWEEIARGLTVLGASMAILAISLNVMNGTLAGSAAILIAAAALAVLAPVLSLLGAMSWESIAKSLITLAGALTIIGVAGLVLAPVLPVILGLSAALALIGVGVLAVGAGLLAAGVGLSALAVGFTALAAAGVAGATSFVAALTVIIVGIAAMIPTVIGKIGEGIVEFAKAIAAGAPALMKAITTILQALAEAIVKAIPELLNAVVEILTSLLELVAKYTPRIVDAAVDIIVAILDGIADAIPRIIQAAVDIIAAFLIGIGQAIPQVVDAGFKMIIDFINGMADSIRTNTPVLVDAMNNLGDAMVEAMITVIKGTGVDKFILAGNQIVAGFIKGIKEKFTSIANVGIELGEQVLGAIRNKLDIHSPSRETEKQGAFTGQGFIEGLKKTFSGVTSAGNGLGGGAMDGIADGINKNSEKTKKASKKAAKSAFDIFKEGIDDQKYYNKLGLDEELAQWEAVQQKYKAGSEERKKIDREVYRLKNEIISNQYRLEKEWIDDERYYKRASLNDELQYWIKIQEKYNALGDEYDAQRIETDKKVFKLREDVTAEAFNKEKEWIDDKKYYGQLSLKEELGYWKGIQQQFLAGSKEREDANKQVYRVEKELAKEAFDNAKNWISERKYYNELSLKEELYAWEQIQDAYEEGSAERIEADREVYRVEKEINQLREDLEKNRLEIEKDAIQKRKDLEDDYYNKTKEVNEKLKQDIDEVNQKYEDAVKSRAETIAKSYNLFDYAKIGGGVEGQVLLDNLDSQIVALEDWTNDINGLADRGISQGLLDELRGMGPSSASEIKALNSLTDEQLTQYVALWQKKQAMAKDQALLELESMKTQTETKIKELTEIANQQLVEYKNTWDSKLAEVNATATAKLAELQAEFDSKIGELSSQTRRQVRELTDDIEDAIEVSSDNIVGQVTDLTENIQTAMMTPDWVSIGTNIIAGIQKGINDKAEELARTAARVAREALEAAEDALDINSPSGEFRKVGMYSDLGFAKGLRDYAGTVTNESDKVGQGAINSISSAVDEIWKLIDSGIDSEPTIRPILDLSNVEAGTAKLNSMFSQSQASKFSASLNRQNGSQIQNEGLNSKIQEPSSYNFTQNNYSPKALSRIEIYRQTNNQISQMERIIKS